MNEEESIIQDLWTEFAREEYDETENQSASPFRCMGIRWHGYIGALQGAEDYLKRKGLIDSEGNKVWDSDDFEKHRKLYKSNKEI